MSSTMGGIERRTIMATFIVVTLVTGPLRQTISYGILNRLNRFNQNLQIIFFIASFILAVTILFNSRYFIEIEGPYPSIF
jgi:hypothetical protein